LGWGGDNVYADTEIWNVKSNCTTMQNANTGDKKLLKKTEIIELGMTMITGLMSGVEILS